MPVPEEIKQSFMKLANDALIVQSACNGGAVAAGLARAFVELRALHVAVGLPTDTKVMNTSPIIVLFITQLHHLAGLGLSDSYEYQRAYAKCERLSGGEDPVAVLR